MNLDLNLHWYKTINPIEPYQFYDVSQGMAGYKKKQDYPDRDYKGYGKLEDVYFSKRDKLTVARKFW